MTASLTVAAARIAVAIVLDAVALIVWDVGTRSPFRLVADMRAACSRPATLGPGLVRCAAGALGLLAAIVAIAPLALRSTDLTLLAAWALAAALLIEQLVGPDLRARVRGNRGRPAAGGRPIEPP